jgi:hypothetical protein
MNEKEEDMKTFAENIQENLKKTMEEIRSMNQAKLGSLRSLLRQMEKHRWY